MARHPFGRIRYSDFPNLHSMYKIILNAMWSKDYLKQLALVLCECMPCALEEANQHIRDLSLGKRIVLMTTTVSKAEALGCDLVQFGCYLEVEQVGPLTDEMMLADLKDWFDEDQRHFRVLYGKDGHVQKIIEERGYGFLRLESQVVSDWVGEELIRCGAQRLELADWPALKSRLDQATEANELRRLEIRNKRSAEKNRRLARGESIKDLELEEE